MTIYHVIFTQAFHMVLWLMLGPVVFKGNQGQYHTRFMTVTELGWDVGLLLFALGFLQLARMTKRED